MFRGRGLWGGGGVGEVGLDGGREGLGGGPIVGWERSGQCLRVDLRLFIPQFSNDLHLLE